jgi:hypothetical protein
VYEMNVLPPWKLAERYAWAEARPWLAGFYFGLLMSLFFAAYPVIIGGTEQLYLAALVGLACWPLCAVGVKLRWGQRPDAKAYPPPTYRRMWSRMSDTWLLFFMWTGISVVIFTPYFILTRAIGTASGLIRLIPALYFTLSTWIERRRRRRPD